MDCPPWYFLLNSPDDAIPFPWERYFDVQAEFLLYFNVMDDTTIFDLRPRVNLGGGLFYVNSYWNELRADSSYNPPRFHQVQPDADCLAIVPAACRGPRVYLLLREPVLQCPLCNGLVRRINIAYTFY